MDRFLDDLEGPAMIVAHGILGQVLRGRVLGLDRREIADLSNRQGCVYHLKNGVERCLARPQGV